MKLLDPLLCILRPLPLVVDFLSQHGLPPLCLVADAGKVVLKTIHDLLRLLLAFLHHLNKATETCGFAGVRRFLFSQLTLEVLDAGQGLRELMRLGGVSRLQSLQRALGGSVILSEGIMSSLQLGELCMLRAAVFGEFLGLGGELRSGTLGLASRKFQLLSKRVKFELKKCHLG